MKQEVRARMTKEKWGELGGKPGDRGRKGEERRLVGDRRGVKTGGR